MSTSTALVERKGHWLTGHQAGSFSRLITRIDLPKLEPRLSAHRSIRGESRKVACAAIIPQMSRAWTTARSGSGKDWECDDFQGPPGSANPPRQKKLCLFDLNR
jgi:hypothetical protein